MSISFNYKAGFRAVLLAFALAALIDFAFALRWSHMSFTLTESLTLTLCTAAFAWSMGWLERKVN